jgi:release factor glutamine methyltransferase
MKAGICFDPHLSRNEAQRQLTAIFAGLASAALDARLILCAGLDIDHAALIRDPDRPIGAAAERIAELAGRRSNGEPASRILGHREFWGLDFAIGPCVLDPRPETEVLVEALAAALASRRDAPLRILDLGTGSGAILGALLSHFPNARGVGVDISEAACRLARRNLHGLGLASRVCVLCGDWTKALRGGFDVIVSNPPYVAAREFARLAPEVRDHDPKLALDGGKDGLAAYRAIVPSLAALAKPGGIVALELGAGQAGSVAHMLASSGFTLLAVHPDLAGHERAITACLDPGHVALSTLSVGT